MNLILTGKSEELLKTLADNSIDCCVTSPPYDKARTYGQSNLSWDFETIAKELYRILKPGSALCWNVNDMVVNGSESLTSAKQKIFFAEQCGFTIHDTMIYHKTNFSHPEKTRYHQIFEYVFVFSKGKLKTFNPIRDKVNSTAGQVGNLGVNTFTEGGWFKRRSIKKDNG